MANINKIKNFVTELLGGKPTTGTTLNYLVFVFISFVFWAFLSLNNIIQYDIEIPIKINSIPKNTTIISDVPNHVNVNVKDKGISLLKFKLGEVPTLNLDFKEFTLTEGVFYVSNTDLRKKIRGILENSTILQTMSLENIDLKFTDLPPKKVPVKLDLDVRPNLQYVIHGVIKQNYDSVLVYSDKNTLADISEVYTNRIEERELSDSLLRTISITQIEGAKIVPDKINIIIPVEALISKRIKIPVQIKDVPSDINVITFPAEVDVSFLVPFSEYRKNRDFHAFVTYDDVMNTKGNKIGVKIDNAPTIYSNITLEQDSVEYIIEKQ